MIQKKIIILLIISTIVVLGNAQLYNPPTNVIAVANGPNVEISWEEPINSNEIWFSHVTSDNIFAGNPMMQMFGSSSFEYAQRFSPVHLQDFGVSGMLLTKVSYFCYLNNPNDGTPISNLSNIAIKIYTGGTSLNPGTIVHQQPVSAASLQDAAWNEIDLTSPVEIPTEVELWIGISWTQGYRYHHVGIGTGPALTGYGDLIYAYGEWAALSDWATSSRDANMMIKGMASFQENHTTRDLTGYNVYRSTVGDLDNENSWTLLASNISETSYSDVTWNLLPNNHVYYYPIKALYSGNIMSIATISNSVIADRRSNVFINLSTSDGSNPTGAHLLLTNNDFPLITYQETGQNNMIIINEVLSGNYTLSISMDGYENYIELNQYIDEVLVELHITLVQIVSYTNVEINLTSNDGGSIVGALLELSNNSNSIVYTQTSEEQLVIFYSVESGSYTLSIVLERYEPYVHDSLLIDGENVYLDIELAKKVSEVDQNSIPTVLHMVYNYPNPFNPETTIVFEIVNESYIEIDIFNVKGQKIKSLKNEHFTKGRYEITWNGIDETGQPVSSGNYYVRITDSKNTYTRKILLLK